MIAPKALPFVLALILSATADAAPRFIPSPKQAFDEFTALNAPRPDVPVGALWIDGYGPTGPAASPDNLETVRSLNGMTIDNNLQLSLTAGLFDLIGIEPRLRDHYSARFQDLTIVKVKDALKLTGPQGEPRIVEAIKAGSISVNSDGEFGLNAHAGFQIQKVDGTTTNARTRSYGIEGHDLFIAIRVATLKIARSEERDVALAPRGADLVGRINDFEIVLRREGCAGFADVKCSGAVTAGVVKLSSWPEPKPSGFVTLDAQSGAVLSLPVPIADGSGGLFDLLAIRWIPPCAARRQSGCRRGDRLSFHYEGRRLDELEKPKMVRW